MNHWNFQELHETPSQTGGPYVHIGLLPQQANIEVFENNFNNQLVKENTLGERIRLEGQVFDGLGLPLRDVLIEIWQANAAGRYVHRIDQHDAPLDPNFQGSGRCITDSQGNYRFYSVKPGAYPWSNHPNAWRPNHIHFSLFGPGFATRLITQMYFPGDPLLDLDPIFQATPEGARDRLVSRFSLDVTQEGYALGYSFDIVLRGRGETPMET